MNVFVTGATGALGQTTVPRLRAAGHEVRGVARGADKAEWLRAQGAEPVMVDLFDAAAVEDAVHGTDAVAHLATNVPRLTRAGRPKAWAVHNRLRAEATPLLVGAALAAGAAVFVKESVAFFYRDGGAEWLDEDAPVTSGKLIEPTLAGERAVERFAGSGRRGVVLRFGLFYGPTSRGVDESLALARLGRSPLMGAPDSYQPMVHLDDAATAVVAALERAPSGVYNVVDEPVTKGANLAAFARAFGRRRVPKPIPTRLVTLVGGRDAAFLAASQRTSNARFREATGWAPEHPSVIEGWPAVARARERAGA